jgi:TetR/AcrR family transcriptional regulator, tetracycline repressor protein
MPRTRRRRARSVSDPDQELPLTVARIVEAALGLLDEVGLAGLSMRRLAERLGIHAATLYWYVRDKQELLSLLAEAICREIQPPDPDAPWRVRLETLMWEYRRVLRAHRDAAHILAATLPAGSQRLRLVDLTLGAVMAAGFDGWAASRAGRLVVDFTTGFVQEEYVTAARSAPPTPPTAEHGSRDAVMDHLDHLPTIAEVAEVSAQAYPNIAVLSPYLTDTDGDARFGFGLGVILDGLQQRRGH